MKASPTPWTASDAPDGTGIPGWNIVASDKMTVCSMMNTTSTHAKLNASNSDLIVRAVNAHAALVEACEALRCADVTATDVPPGMDDHYIEVSIPVAVVRKLDAALALARGEK